MPDSYLPTTDGGKLTFAKNMVALITVNPVLWGLTSAILTVLSGLVSAYEAAFDLAKEPATKSRANTYAKNQTRDEMVRYIRDVIVPTVQGCATVTDQMKYDMALTVKGANPPTPIQAPTQIPVITVRSVNGYLVDIAVTTADSPRRGLPDGVAGINIWTSTAPVPPTDPAEWEFEGESSKARLKIQAPETLPVGSKFHIVCCFKSPRLQTGPACGPTTVIVGGGIPETNIG